jgi:hypothetical protein
MENTTRNIPSSRPRFGITKSKTRQPHRHNSLDKNIRHTRLRPRQIRRNRRPRPIRQLRRHNSKNRRNQLTRLHHIKGDYIDHGWPNDATTWMVPWGSNWVQRTYDFIMPSQYYGDGGWAGSTAAQVPKGTYATPTYICPWLEISANYGNTQGTYTTWFSDFQLYINP